MEGLKTISLFLVLVAIGFASTNPIAVSDPMKEFMVSESDDDVNFFLWTSENPDTYDLLKADDTDLIAASHFDASKPTKIFAHGYGGNGSIYYAIIVKDAWLADGDYNVISVDWGTLAAKPNYFKAASSTSSVGQQTGLLIDTLVQSANADISTFHLVGVSLGAHVVGFAGKSVTVGTLPRITGLDPAGPAFYLKGAANRIAETDADFVDIIHTNGGLLIEGCYGLNKELGDADFYPNGGVHQSQQCSLYEDASEFCSHKLSVNYYIHSIRTSDYPACPCSDWNAFEAGRCDCGDDYVLMGDKCPSSASGKYYLTISA